jgi:uncharacterized protein
LQSIPTFENCIQLLIEYSVPDRIISHLLFTTKTAISIAEQLKNKRIPIKCELVIAGALLHDIGRSQSHNIDHGIVGGKILKTHGFPLELVSIVEKHIYAGISAYEAKDLGLPSEDYIPRTYEEKIVAYADNISKTDELLSLEQVLKRFKRYLPDTHSILVRVRELHEEIETLLQDNKEKDKL